MRGAFRKSTGLFEIVLERPPTGSKNGYTHHDHDHDDTHDEDGDDDDDDESFVEEDYPLTVRLDADSTEIRLKSLRFL